MNEKISLLAGLTALFAMGPAGASNVLPPPPACPTPVVGGSDTNDDTGHYYQVFKAKGITWECAKTFVDALPPYNAGVGQPVTGHLATITSGSEDEWVDVLRAGSGLERPEVWIGGVQAPGQEVGIGWRWDNGEGPIATSATPLLGSYQNWLPDEPNDNTGVDSENYLAIGLGGAFGWNDEGNLGNIGGFVVEYDVPRTAECAVGEGCETITGHTLTFPQGWVSEGDTIAFTAYEFTDLRVGTSRCGKDGLTLFSDLNDGKPELRIPPYLCGSPQFVVIAVDGSDLSFDRGGTVLIENDTATVLPGNTIKDCKDTKGPILPSPGEDPQYQDVVVYQTTDPGRMLEDSVGSGLYDGAAGEFTNSCGSSRGTGKETSYFVVGMHIDFGTGYDLDGNPAGNHFKFVELTRYKLTLLQKSIVAARSAGALRIGVSYAMDALVSLAIYRLDRGDPAGALILVKQFLRLVDAVRYTPTPGENFNGEHLMRGTNIEFTLRVKVIPYAP